MANSTTNLDLISSGQAQKEITSNAISDALSKAAIYGRRASTTTALTWGFYGGKLYGVSSHVANGTIALTASSTNYVEADHITGAVSVNTTAFTVGKIPCYQIVTGASTVTSYLDYRDEVMQGGGGGGGGGSALTVKDEGTILSTAVTSINFVGTGITATNTGGDVTVDLTSKQDVLVSGTNLKSINGTSLIGSGDLVIAGSDTFTNDINIGASRIGHGVRNIYGEYYTNYCFGNQALVGNSIGNNNIGIGFLSLYGPKSEGNIAIGTMALRFVNTDSGGGGNNTALGFKAGNNIYSGAYNTLIGSNTGYSLENGLGAAASAKSNVTAVGCYAGYTSNYSGYTCLGANTEVTGDNQIQLGDSSTTTYVFGTVQNRSDLRDKADIIDTKFGLDFILSLRPVDYKWNLRCDYSIKEIIKVKKQIIRENGIAEEIEVDEFKITNLTNDGSKTRNRFHHGFIAQDLVNTNFGGLQDHSKKGGEDVMSLGYDEFIAPLVKAIQEQQLMIIALKTQVEALFLK